MENITIKSLERLCYREGFEDALLFTLDLAMTYIDEPMIASKFKRRFVATVFDVYKKNGGLFPFESLECEEELFLADSYRLKPVLARDSIRKGYSNDFVSSDEIFEIIIQHYHEINMTNYNGVISIEEIGELLEE